MSEQELAAIKERAETLSTVIDGDSSFYLADHVEALQNDVLTLIAEIERLHAIITKTT